MKSILKALAAFSMILCILMVPFNLLLATAKNEVKNLDLMDSCDEYPNSSNIWMEEDVYPYGISNRIVGVREFN